MTARARGASAAALSAVLFACGSSPEQDLLDQFFRALGQEDRTTISGISMASFPGGPVASWELLEVGPETPGPYRVPELRAEEASAKTHRDDQFKAFYDFREANREQIEAITARRDRDPDAPLGRGLGEIAAEWDAYRSERRRLVSSLSEVQMALDEERRRAQRSLLREAPVDYLTGNIVEMEVLVRTVEREAARADYRFSLIRYDLRNQFETRVASRWIIAAIEPVPAAGATSP